MTDEVHGDSHTPLDKANAWEPDRLGIALAFTSPDHDDPDGEWVVVLIIDERHVVLPHAAAASMIAGLMSASEQAYGCPEHKGHPEYNAEAAHTDGLVN